MHTLYVGTVEMWIICLGLVMGLMVCGAAVCWTISKILAGAWRGLQLISEWMDGHVNTMVETSVHNVPKTQKSRKAKRSKVLK